MRDIASSWSSFVIQAEALRARGACSSDLFNRLDVPARVMCSG